MEQWVEEEMKDRCAKMYKPSSEHTYIMNNAGCKSKMKLGNITYYNTKRFNWFHRLMFKVVFGIEIENI